MDRDPQWYKDAIIYELHIKAFHDSTGDGIGDLRGLIQKLDYLEGLGVTAIWLLPFYPSPLRDDGYDIAEYLSINPDFGSLNDFKVLLKEAHNRGLRVITELVINHTSDQHPWFQRARRAKAGSKWRDFYVWSETTEKYEDARIIFKDFEQSNWSWDSIAKAYYWHRFYSHQPDLNFDNPRVQKEIIKVMDFWFEMGVDGLRLDAVPYLYEREGTNCENLPETYTFLETLRAHVDAKFPGGMLLAEANQWPEDAVAYFGKGDRCHMAFHFPVMPRMFMGLRREDRFPIIDILEQTPSIPESCQWAMFLRNHDELTLEMVTDEERDYMYRVYAKDPHAKINMGIRRRLAPLLDNNRRKIELMNILLFSLPGTPVIYYGDEIGMGDNYYLGDRDGVRTPMQWSPDRNAGFSKTNPHQLYLPVIIDPEYHYEAVNVETQEGSPSSMLWWMKRVIAMRRRFKSFGRGSLAFLPADNSKVLAFAREYEGERIVVIVNLSRFSQVVELDLSRYLGLVPVEVFSQNRFPAVKTRPYVVTLGPHDHYWLLMKRERSRSSSTRRTVPELHIDGKWESVFDGLAGSSFEDEVLPDYLRGSRWFSGKGRAIQSIEIVENLPLHGNGCESHLLACQITYTDGTPEVYVLPVSFISDDSPRRGRRDDSERAIAHLHSSSGTGSLYDSLYDEGFRTTLLSVIARRRKIKGRSGELVGYAGRRFKNVAGDSDPSLGSRLLGTEQSNTSMVYENKLFLKLYRRFDEGISPDTEISRFLTEKTRFQNSPIFAGSIEYRRPGAEPVAVAMLQGYTPSEADAWTFTLDALGRYLERVLSLGDLVREPPQAQFSFLEIEGTSPDLERLIAGLHLEMMRLLGIRTAEMHLALASVPDDPNFAPEPYSVLYQRSLYQSMRSQVKTVFPLLRANLRKLPVSVAAEAKELLAAENALLECQARILEKKLVEMKIRVHGDYHLGQVLFTGKDFIIIDFEGEPARPSGERRLKRSPLKDIAGMMRSFHYAGYTALFQQGHIRAEDQPLLGPWVDLWTGYVTNTFLKSYFEAVKGSVLLPNYGSDTEVLLQALLLEKAVYELGYEINNRPDWVLIPIRGITTILANRAQNG